MTRRSGRVCGGLRLCRVIRPGRLGLEVGDEGQVQVMRLLRVPRAWCAST